ncbi:MAG: hypothetical protein R2765_12540 [Ferruginibacter sp.]|nr:hypothetical protein [Bacteroidota bacterium]MBX2918461.1 hypothetical protein [Ferruginibacter sp.]MCC7378485.1 hypothetical protein [Chitinophagaceae bacterium]
MKLRIKANSVRIRLTKTEVNKLATESYLQEATVLPGQTFIYAIKSDDNATALTIAFENNILTMMVPKSFAANWHQNDMVGMDAWMQVNEKEKLYLLLEKDFVCLDETAEDQSDNYENPNKKPVA